MGKERVRRRHRFNPMAASVTSHSTSRPESHQIETLQPHPFEEQCESSEHLVAALRSTTSTERTSAATLLAAIANDLTSRHEALRPEVIRAAAPLLLDEEAVASVASWLRDVSHAGPEVCGTLVQENLLSHLVVVLHKLLRSESLHNSSQNAVLLDCLNALTNICENSDEAVQFVTRENLVPELFRLLIAARTSKLPITVGQCLLTLSEDNPPFQSMLSPQLNSLEAVLHDSTQSAGHLLFKTTVAGIMNNLGASSCLQLMVSTVKEALEYEIADHLSALNIGIVQLRNTKLNEDTRKELDWRLIEMFELLQAKKISLEILVNVCCTEDDDEQWVDCDEEDEDAMSVRSHGASEVREQMSEELQTCLSQIELLPAILNHIGPLDASIVATLNEYKPAQQIIRDIHDVRCRAMLCIDNLAQSLDLSRMSSPDNIREIGSKLLQIALSTQMGSHNGKSELFEAASSACRAVLEALARTGVSPPVLTEEELSCLCRIALSNKGSPTGRVNVTRIVATLTMSQRNLLSGTGGLLLRVAMQDTDLRVCSEAIDALIDVFADDETDTIAREVNLVTEMRTLAPRFKQMMRASPKGESKLIASTCLSNLLRFIKYKGKRLN